MRRTEPFVSSPKPKNRGERFFIGIAHGVAVPTSRVTFVVIGLGSAKLASIQSLLAEQDRLCGTVDDVAMRLAENSE